MQRKIQHCVCVYGVTCNQNAQHEAFELTVIPWIMLACSESAETNSYGTWNKNESYEILRARARSKHI